MKYSTNFQGAHAEAQFIAYALENGWEVTVPFNKAVAYDYVIRRSPEVPWETVQVKRAYYANRRDKKQTKILEVGLRKRYGTKISAYKTGDFDWLFSFHKDGRWFLPWDLVKKRRSAVQIGSPRYDLWRV
jgi:PD-(D/E)XK nuclease superfamily protein